MGDLSHRGVALCLFLLAFLEGSSGQVVFFLIYKRLKCLEIIYMIVALRLWCHIVHQILL